MALHSHTMNREQIQEMIINYNGTRKQNRNSSQHSPSIAKTINRSDGNNEAGGNSQLNQSYNATNEANAHMHPSSQLIDITAVESSDSDEEPNMFEVTKPSLANQTQKKQHLSSNYNHHRNRHQIYAHKAHQARHHPYNMHPQHRYNNRIHNRIITPPKHNKKRYGTQLTQLKHSRMNHNENERNSFYETQTTTVLCTDIEPKPISAPLHRNDSRILKTNKSHLNGLKQHTNNPINADMKRLQIDTLEQETHEHDAQRDEDIVMNVIAKNIKSEVNKTNDTIEPPPITDNTQKTIEDIFFSFFQD